MRKKVVKLGSILLVTAILFTGCGNQLPDMEPEQIQVIGDYAAGLLLKYDASNRSRLVDLSAVEEKKQETNSTEPSEKQEETKSGMAPVDDTPVVSVGEEIGTESASLEACLSLPEGITLTYQGEQLTNSYPDLDAGEIGFVLDAVKGKKLLILSFLLENHESESREVDIFSGTPSFRVTVNDNISKMPLVTLLENDLSTYIGTIPGGESREVVLILEVEETAAGEIQSVVLNVKGASGNARVQLK